MREQVSEVGSHCAILAASIQSTCPGLSRLYMFKQLKTRGKGSCYLLEPHHSCVFCHNLFTPGNHTVRLLPRPKFSNRIRKLLQRYEENPKSLGKFQLKVVKDFLSSRNRVAIHCSQCGRTHKIDGQTRTDRQQQRTGVQRQALAVAGETLEVEEPKTKKQKKKEKQKMMKKKKKMLMNQEEVNAGLLLDPGIKTETISSSGSAATAGPLSSPMNSSTSLSSTPVQKTAKTMPTSSTKLETKSKTLQNKSNANKLGAFMQVSGLQTSQRPQENIQMSSVKKKKKLKQQNQQLGNILKKEKNKTQPQEASLMDFLSSL